MSGEPVIRSTSQFPNLSIKTGITVKKGDITITL